MVYYRTSVINKNDIVTSNLSNLWNKNVNIYIFKLMYFYEFSKLIYFYEFLL